MKDYVIFALDRDGTLIEDHGEYPGSKGPDEQFTLRPGVVKGLQLLHGANDGRTAIIMITNQSGPARGKVKEEHIHPFHAAIQEELRMQGCLLDKMLYCTHVPPKYAEQVEKRPADNFIDRAYVAQCPDRKPGIGMLEIAAHELWHAALKQCLVYVVGDRMSDIETALNARKAGADAVGVFTPSNVKGYENEREKVIALKQQHPNNVYLANNFFAAACWMRDDLHRRQNGST